MNRKIAWRSFFFSFLLVSVCNAETREDLSLVFNGVSYHVNASHDWNEDNRGFGLEYAFSERSQWRKVAMVNGFRDSTDRMSYMTGVGLHRRLLQRDAMAGLYIDAGVNAFLMTRKDVNNNRPFPGVLPSLSVGNDYIGLNLTYLPKIAVEKVLKANMTDPHLSGVLFVQFKASLDKILF